jgi:pimeloyl-ACP methyl ester carboxylesterase
MAKPGTNWDIFVGVWSKEVRNDSHLLRLVGAAKVNLAVAYGSKVVAFSAADGFVEESDLEPAFTLHADESDWDLFFQQFPPPAYQSFFGMLMRVESASVQGNELAFIQHVHIVRRVLELGRKIASGSPAHLFAASKKLNDERTGSYLQIKRGESATNVFVEQAGRGQDVLLLHTAGADSRQFRHIMNDSRITDGYRLVAFDLPGHGRSALRDDVQPGAQALTTDDYVDSVMSVARSMGLCQPIVVGASMAGAICLELARRHPDELGGVVACEASDYIEGRQVEWAKHPLVNESLFVPEWIEGLMAPQSPQIYRDEIWWTYSQGGYGTFFGDIHFYNDEWDGRESVTQIDTTLCPVFMLTGEYDYSCTPDMSRATAAKIPGAIFEVMPELGHFPHAENPPRFIDYLLPVLAKIVNGKD